MAEFRPIPEPITIEFEELEGSPHSEKFDRYGFSAIQEFKCAWDERHTLAKEMIGGRLVTRTVSGVITTYIVPGQEYPHYGYAKVYMVEMKPFWTDMTDSTETEAVYGFAHLTIYYKTPDYSDPNNPELVSTERVEPSAQVLNLDGAGLFWDVTPGAEKPIAADEAPGLIVRMEDWIYTKYNEGKIDPTIFDKVGYTNSTPVTSLTYKRTFAPDTLMFLGPEPTEERTSDGDRKFTTSYRFTFNPWGWNKLPRRMPSGVIQFQYALNASGVPVVFYPSTDLSGIL